MPFKFCIGNTLIPSHSTLFLEYQNIKANKLGSRNKLNTIEILLNKLYKVHIVYFLGMLYY